MKVTALPLMNVVSPAAFELALYYVGEKNQEMMGALNASIWAGSWFFSSVIFGVLRAYEISYVYIFMMTVVLYLIVTLQYYLLIKDSKTYTLFFFLLSIAERSKS